MILGSFSVNADPSLVCEQIRIVTDCEGLIFCPVVHGGFTGGYYLNNRLPWGPADFYYSDELNDIVVLMSGCVYNRSELSELYNSGPSACSPEIVAGLFWREGPGFVKRLNGDFAIYIGQPVKKQVYLFRDHVGIRPLAWAADKQDLSFSSEADGLCRVFSDGREIDADYLLGYFKYVDYRKTPCEKVKKLLPGHFLHFSENGVEVKRYWEPERISIDRNLQHDRMLSDLKSLVTDAVKIRCDSRFRAGGHVTGGLDSGIVSTLARKEYQHQETFYGFSWSPRDYAPDHLAFDERDIVGKLCQQANIKPVFSGMTQTDFLRAVSSFYYNKGFFSEEGTIDKAVALNINLLFSGWGGDEFISTGIWATELDLFLKLKLGTFFRRNPVKHPGRLMGRLRYFILYAALGTLNRSTAKSFRDDARYIREPFKRSDRKAIRTFYFCTSRHKHHLDMLNFYHLQQRCEGWTINGYRKGVEYRYPLLDRRIIEYMLTVPSELLCKTDYYRPLLREIGEGILPDEVRLHRSKNDPVYWTWMDELFKSAGIGFMEEVDAWERNPDLQFVDFDLLKQDIAGYESQSHGNNSKVLFRALVYIRMIHGFTKKYHELD